MNDGATFGGATVGDEDDDEDEDGTTGNATGVSAGATLTTTAATETATSTSGPSTSSDPSSDSTGEDGSTTEDETTGGVKGESSSGSSSTGTTIACGDGIAEGDEDCDGDDLLAMTCEDMGDFTGGTLACAGDCTFDTSECTVELEPVEICANVNVGIPDSGGGSITQTVTVPAGGNVGDVRASVNIDHTYIGDLSIDLVHGATTVRLYDETCTSQEDMTLTYDDAGGVLDCNTTTSGADIQPDQALSGFDGAAAGGAWNFVIEDHASLDTGTLLQMCVFITF